MSCNKKQTENRPSSHGQETKNRQLPPSSTSVPMPTVKPPAKKS